MVQSKKRQGIISMTSILKNDVHPHIPFTQIKTTN